MSRSSPPFAASGRVLVFDSGIGGLTIVEALRRSAPDLQIDYAADTGFFPYGDKSDAALCERLPMVAAALSAAARPEVFVIACNTASTLALDEVRAALDIPVVGTVPAIKPAAERSQTGAIGLLATPGTVRRAYTDRLIGEFARDVRVVKHGSVDLVRLAEAVAQGHAPPLDLFAAAQAPLFAGDAGAAVDTIVLACTHFPIVRDQLAATAPRPVAYIDSGAAIARQTLSVLAARDGAAPRSDQTPPTAYITDDPAGHADLIDVFRRYGFDRVQDVAPAADGKAMSSALSR